MAAKHKNSGSSFRATTRLDPDRVAELATAAGATVKSSIPGQPFVRFEGAQPGQLNFSVRSLGGRTEIMTFTALIKEADGTTSLETKIGRFKTSQSTFMLIPVGPKSLLGYGQYKKFASALNDGLRSADPSSHGQLVERPA